MFVLEVPVVIVMHLNLSPYRIHLLPDIGPSPTIAVSWVWFSFCILEKCQTLNCTKETWFPMLQLVVLHRAEKREAILV